MTKIRVPSVGEMWRKKSHTLLMICPQILETLTDMLIVPHSERLETSPMSMERH